MHVEYYIAKTSVVAGVSTNLLLLYCIRQHTRVKLGAYKQLLTIFASYDLFLSVLHEFVDPKVLIINATVIGLNSNSNIDDRKFISFYVSCFTVLFALMNINLLYRYWSISKPHLIRLYSNNIFIIFLIGMCIGVFTGWYLLCLYGMFEEEKDESIEQLRVKFEHRFGKNKTEGWIVMNWDDNSKVWLYNITLAVFDLLLVISFLAALTLALLTYIGIRESLKISKVTANLHFRLFIAVTAQTLLQTIVPLICVYTPYFWCLTLTYFRIPASKMAYASFILTAIFPAWDAVVIIILMADYRNAIWSIITCQKPQPVNTVIFTQMSTMTKMPTMEPNSVTMPNVL